MKTIILAAGTGQRLMPFTRDIPKTLLNINGETVLENIIRKCVNNNIYDFIIVVGHKKERVIEHCNILKLRYNINIELMENKRYMDTNTACSLYIALSNKIDDDIIIINGDNIFDEQLITNLVETPCTSLVIDNVKKLDKESFKVEIEKIENIIKNKIIIKNIGKELDIGNSTGEFIGISKVSKEELYVFRTILNRLIESNLQQYYDVAFKELSKETIIGFVYTNGLKWTEIDTSDDLEFAQKIFKN